ncbi:hypothetical protein [Actinoplanes sp. NPDC051494]|uniref:hypothetical protein n=1 Tax=Actinoplanes sp. NPDC051494 TaxID=3363907 RepID=UPI0037B8A6DE
MKLQRTLIAVLAVGFAALAAPMPAQAAPGDPELVTISYGETNFGGRGDVLDHSVTLSIENTGDNPIYGVRYAFEFPQHFGVKPVAGPKNCSTSGYDLECYFAVTLAPHTTYKVDMPFQIEDRYPHPDGHRVWIETDQWFLGGLTKPASGTGAELELQPKGEPIPDDAPAQKIDRAGSKIDNTMYITRRGGSDPDLAAVASTGPVTGEVGDTIRPTIGARNDGPAGVGYAIINDDFNMPAKTAFVQVKLPEGVSVLSAPRSCLFRSMQSPEVDGEPYADRKEFTCADEGPLMPGATLEYPFDLRIDEPLEDAKVTVTVAVPDDKTTQNNTAGFLINPSGAGASTPATTAPATAVPTTEVALPVAGAPAEDDTLPITGTPVALITTTGAALAVGGGLALLLARRRRMRFTAGS